MSVRKECMKKLLQSNAGAVLAAGFLMVLGGFGLTGCQTSYRDQVRFSPVEGEEDLTGTPVVGEAARLALGDPVRIIFSGLTDPPPVHEEQIKDDGNLTLPNIGVVKAEGKTTGELQKEIHDKYVPAYYKRLTVTVSTERRVYYVQGQVRSSGRQEYIGPTTVLKAIATAGDFTDFANRRKVVLTRADGKQEKVDCIRAAKDPTCDLPVFPGDKIEVPMRGFDFR
jgi:protein involved in polysaccharide export with SLBB domain